MTLERECAQNDKFIKRIPPVIGATYKTSNEVIGKGDFVAKELFIKGGAPVGGVFTLLHGLVPVEFRVALFRKAGRGGNCD